MKIKNKASVIIYVLILTSLSLLLAVIVMDNYSQLSNNKNYYDVEMKFLRNMNYDGKVSADFDKQLNSDGSGFIDNISCPTSFTMSGTTYKNTNVNTSLYITGSTVTCSGSYNSKNLQIYFNDDNTDFNRARYDSSYIIINNQKGNFNDSDDTKIDFSSYTQTGDLIDDNLNSDNYRANSTGSTDYPNNYIDNDDLARRMIIGYIPYTAGYKKVFWNNKKINNYIENNTNNTGSLVENIGEVSSGALYINIDKAYDIKLVEFDRNKYTYYNELYVLSSITSSGSTGKIGYLQNDLSLSSSTGSAYSFDFKNNDYALFLRTSGTGTILYNIKAIDLNTNKEIYINPIDDSDDSIIKYLGNEIFINEEGQFISKKSEILFAK